jgi:hypothetical protein
MREKKRSSALSPRRRGGGLQTQPPSPSFGFMLAQRIGGDVPAPTAR